MFVKGEGVQGVVLLLALPAMVLAAWGCPCHPASGAIVQR